MKKQIKLFGLLLAVPLLFATSCNDGDKDIPDVSITTSVTGAYTVPDSDDSNYYVVAGDTLTVEGIYIKSNTGDKASLGTATYIWNGYQIGYNPVYPFGWKIPTSAMNVGNNILSIELPVLVVGYPVNTGVIEMNVVVVASEDQLPSGAELLQPEVPEVTAFQYRN